MHDNPAGPAQTGSHEPFPQRLYLVNDTRVIARSFQDAINKFAASLEGRYPREICCHEHEDLWDWPTMVELHQVRSVKLLGDVLL